MTESATGVTTELVNLAIEDDIVLDGALWTPRGGASETAIALSPGTGAEFYHRWLSFAGPRLAAAGHLTLSLNRRDHGGLLGFHRFEDAALDHRHAIDFLIARGALRVVLGGHSYGTLTAPYYVAETDDARVPGLLLFAPLGDLRAASVVICGGPDAYDRIVADAREMVAARRGGEAFVIPPMVPGHLPMVHTHEIFLNKRGPEAVTVGADLIRGLGDRPLLGVRDPGDPFPATRPPAREQLEAANPHLDYVLLNDIRDGGSDPEAHGYAGREEEVLEITLAWLDRNGFAP